MAHQTGRHDTGIVQDQKVPGPEVLDDVGEPAMLQANAAGPFGEFPVDHLQPRFVATAGGALRDGFLFKRIPVGGQKKFRGGSRAHGEASSVGS